MRSSKQFGINSSLYWKRRSRRLQRTKVKLPALESPIAEDDGEAFGISPSD